ncbi:hypothetical protein BJV74DRAFT_799791 [Russula compacta]|nr:hypothetical protein BJV74DRAFT_799791 [Russula compacta]
MKEWAKVLCVVKQVGSANREGQRLVERCGYTYLVESVGMAPQDATKEAWSPCTSKRICPPFAQSRSSDSPAPRALPQGLESSGLLQAYHIASGDEERHMPHHPRRFPCAPIVVQRWRALLTLNDTGVMVECLPSANEERGQSAQNALACPVAANAKIVPIRNAEMENNTTMLQCYSF